MDSVVVPKTHVEALTTKCDDTWKWRLWEVIRLGGWSSCDEIQVLIRRDNMKELILQPCPRVRRHVVLT